VAAATTAIDDRCYRPSAVYGGTGMTAAPNPSYVRTRRGSYRHPVNTLPPEHGAVKVLRCQVSRPVFVIPANDDLPICPRCTHDIELENLMSQT